MLQETFHTAKRGGALPQTDRGGCINGCLLATFDADREHMAEPAFHLLERQSMLRMSGQTGIENFLDKRMGAEPLCQIECCF